MVNASNDYGERVVITRVELMNKERKEIKIDEKSGIVLRCGMGKNDKLFQVIQQFESEEMMFEDETDERSGKLMHVVYEGRNEFDQQTVYPFYVNFIQKSTCKHYLRSVSYLQCLLSMIVYKSMF